MSQLYLTGSINAWNSQTAQSGFMDSSSNVLLSGYATQNSINSALAVKYNAKGIAWQQTYSGPYSTMFSDMVQLANGTYMAVGSYFTSGSSGDELIWLVNIDADGNKIASVEMGLPGVQSIGTAIVATADGGFVITGIQSQGNATSTLIAKYNANMTLVWQTSQNDFACYSINACSDGTLILSGRNTPASLNSSPAAILMDANGSVIANTVFSNFSIYILQKTDAIQTSDGSFVMVAQSVIIKFGLDGSVIWSWNTNNGKLTSIAQLTNGNLAMSGSIVVSNVTQAYTVVTDSGGNNIIWDNTELMQDSVSNAVFIDTGYNVVWSANTVYYGSSSLIVFAAFDPATTLAGSSQVKAYAFANNAQKAEATPA